MTAPAEREARFYKWANGTAPKFRKGYAIGLHKRAADAERAKRPTCRTCGDEGGSIGIGAEMGLCWPCEDAVRRARGAA